MVATGYDAKLPALLQPITFMVRKPKARTVKEGSRALINASIESQDEFDGQSIVDDKIVE